MNAHSTSTTPSTTSTPRRVRRMAAGLAAATALAVMAPAGAPASAAPPGAVDILSAVGYDQPGPQGIHRIDWALPDADPAIHTVLLERWDATMSTKLATYVQDADEYEPTRMAGPFADGTVYQYRARAQSTDGWGPWSDWSSARVEVGHTHIRPFVDAEDFVDRQVLDFEAAVTIGQLEGLYGQVDDTAEVTDLVDHLTDRHEVRHREPVIRLYLAYFGRSPEPAGLDYWVDELRTGQTTLSAVSTFFSKSAEFKAQYGGTTDSQFVTLVYQNVLDRNPDPAGFAYWKGRLDQGTITRGTLMLAFSESPEGKSHRAGETAVIDVWTNVLDEQPSMAEVDRFAGHVDAGGTAGDVAVMLFATDAYLEP